MASQTSKYTRAGHTLKTVLSKLTCGQNVDIASFLQVAKEAKRVVARLDAAEQQTQRAYSADPARQKLVDLYSLGHKVIFPDQHLRSVKLPFGASIVTECCTSVHCTFCIPSVAYLHNAPHGGGMKCIECPAVMWCMTVCHLQAW